MGAMRKLILIGILLAGLAATFTACGSSSSETTGTSAAQVEAQLTQRLHLTPTATNLGSFSPGPNTECTVLLVATGATADLYAEDDWVVYHEGAIVKVIPTHPTPALTCMTAVQRALLQEGG